MKEYNFNIEIVKNGTRLVNIEKYRFPEGKITFLFGESGIGKTLANKAVFGLLNDEVLDVKINGMDYDAYKKHEICREFRENGFFVFQEPSSHLNPLLKISDQLTEGDLKESGNHVEILEKLWRKNRHRFYDQVIDIYPKPYRPSGGEKQRVLATMAFCKLDAVKNFSDRNLFVFDEPTGNLDNYFRNVFLDGLIDEFRKKEFTAVFITHDYSVINYLNEKYGYLSDSFIYRELYRTESISKIRDFDAREFTGFDFSRFNFYKKGNNEKLLTVKPGIKVFGRELNFVKEKGSSKKTDLEVKAGELTYLKAPSGVGKTTILKIITGLLHPDSFEIDFAGTQVDANTGVNFWKKNIWGKEAGIVFQHADEALNLQSTVREVFTALPGKKKITDEELSVKLSEVFQEKITLGFLNKKVVQLSGGQKQKINLLRTFMTECNILLLDEPTSGMDFNSIKKFLVILEKKINEGKGVLLVSHNEDIFDPVVKKENVYYLTTTDEEP